MINIVKSSDASFIKIEDGTCELLDGKIIFMNYPLNLIFLKIPRHTKVAKNKEKMMAG